MPQPLTRRRAFQLAWPMIFANVAVPLAGVVDTAVIGAVGDAADLGGVALGVTLFNVFFWSFYFLRMSTTGLAAQASGAGEGLERQRVLLRALGLAGLLGLAVAALRSPLASAGFAILQGGERVEATGAVYFLTRCWGAPGAFAGFALTGWLLGLGRTAAVMAVHVVFSATNVVLDLWFVLGLGQRAEGVAAATAVADWAAALVAGAFVWRALREEGGVQRAAWFRSALLHLPAIRRLLGMNRDLLLRTWALLLGFAWFANTGARLGTAVLAGNHVLQQVVTLWAFVLDAYAFTAEIEVGRAIGTRSLAGLRRAIRLTSELAFASAAGFALATAAGGPWLLGWLISDEAARASALRFLPWCAAIPLVGALAWQLDGIFIGATRSAAMRNASLAALAIYLACDLVLTPAFGPRGMWSAWIVYYLARGATLLVAYPALERSLREPRG